MAFHAGEDYTRREPARWMTCERLSRTRRMIGLFFEVMPLEGHADRYFELAAALKPELERSGGVEFADRYQSVHRPHVFLSHQWWADEASLIRWRENTQHRAIQRAGREQHFSDYRIRIGPDVDPARARSSVRAVWASYYDIEPATAVAGELFKSVYREGHFLVLSETEPGAQDAPSDRKAFDIVRDYTMYDRSQAPQSYPPVKRGRA
jgi:heme-degrading monooxygenase HmoA